MVGPPLLQAAITIARAQQRTPFRITVLGNKLPMLRVRAEVRYVVEVRYLLIAVAAALIISGCGAYRQGPVAVPTPTPGQGAGFGYDVVVTEKDKTATMRVGQKVEVVFHAATNMDSWTQVRSTNESVLIPVVNPAATAVRGVTLAAFKAVAPGQAEITSYANPHCPPGSACPMYVAVVSIKITITP
ncbi:MAG: hypothetical protein PVS3B2_13580 [Candidatus Dormibacteraceae bacterium]